jgi:RNA polymerase sigma factor (sigma-70 family)
MQPEDERIIRGFLAGEPASLSRVERWIASAAQPFRSRLASHHEDLRQDILTELTRLFKDGCFRGDSSLISYVWRITNHASIRQLRSLQRWAPDVNDMLDQQRDGRQTPAERLLRHDRIATIQRLAAQLPAECQELWRRVLAGESYEKMSADLGLTEGTLRVRVLRCRRKALALRETLEDSKHS